VYVHPSPLVSAPGGRAASTVLAICARRACRIAERDWSDRHRQELNWMSRLLRMASAGTPIPRTLSRSSSRFEGTNGLPDTCFPLLPEKNHWLLTVRRIYIARPSTILSCWILNASGTGDQAYSRYSYTGIIRAQDSYQEGPERIGHDLAGEKAYMAVTLPSNLQQAVNL
jgi:hypothetical protein